MKSFLSLFLSLFLSECRTFINTDLSTDLKQDKLRMETLPGTDLANHPSQPKMKYLWKNRHNFQRKYWPGQREEVKMRKNMKPTKGRDSKINLKVANYDEGMDKTLSYFNIIQIPFFLFIYKNLHIECLPFIDYLTSKGVE